MAERLALFATTARGTEELLAEELKELGAQPRPAGPRRRALHGHLDEALRICLWTRIAMRVLYPLGEFEAHGAQGLYDAVASVPWEEHLTPDITFAVEATLKDSEHSHTGFVALKVKDAVVDRMRDKQGARPDVDPRNPDVRVVAHLARERLSLSLDLCGEPLHRRGYRVRPTAAPLKETLAAAILRAASYQRPGGAGGPDVRLGHPAHRGGAHRPRRAPGLNRDFAVERGPTWASGPRAARGPARGRPPQRARCRSPAGLRQGPRGPGGGQEEREAARLRARFASRRGRDEACPAPPSPSGLMLTNPPYGDRLGSGGRRA